jgi:hypothetical protein
MDIIKTLIWTNYIIPHGITDFLVAYETNTMFHMLLLYICCILFGFLINRYLYLFIFSCISIIHFMNDINVYTSMVLIMISLLSLLDNQTYVKYSYNLITGYLSIIHIPIHYYNLSNMIYEYGRYFIVIMANIILYSNLFFFNYLRKMTKRKLMIKDNKKLRLLGSIIISHCIYNHEIIEFIKK